MSAPKKIVLFASGSGSNVINVSQFFKGNANVQIVALFCNNAQAAVIEKIKPFGTPTHVFKRLALSDPTYFLPIIQQYQPDLICLLGFLQKIPAYLVQAYPNKIINLHPALLPKFGGKGMYGMHVHEAVKAANETETGITLHYVNEHYDEGAIIKQFKTVVEPTDTPQSIAAKIAALEMKHVPEVINELLQQ